MATWRDLRSALVTSKTPGDEELAELLVKEGWKSAHSFRHLRAAVEYLFTEVELPRKRVIFPRFICGSVVRAAERAGCRVTFCDVDETGAIDVDKLAEFPLEKFGAVFVVHPFGIPAKMKMIRRLCDEHDIFLIEDCAHVFDRIVDNKAVGTWGDFVLFHFAKKMANVHGGLLLSYRFKLKGVEASSRMSLGEFWSLFLKWDLLRWPLNVLRSVSPLPKDHDAAHDEDFARVVPASASAKRLFKKQLARFRAGKHLRGVLYKVYLDHLPEGFEALDKTVPGDIFQFPVRVKEKDRDRVMKKLRTWGVMADRVWYNADCEIAQSVLLLPLNESMREKDVQFICKLLANV